MKRLINLNLAGNPLLMSLGLLIIFHILVLLNIVPAEIVWGGQIQDSATNLFTLEITALAVTLVFVIIIAAKMDYIKAGKFKMAINIDLWLIFVFLILNTVGNLVSGVSFENLIFAPITLVLIFCALRWVFEKSA